MRIATLIMALAATAAAQSLQGYLFAGGGGIASTDFLRSAPDGSIHFFEFRIALALR